jgi:hypothetical protein
MRRIIVGTSGASGVIYGVRLLGVLRAALLDRASSGQAPRLLAGVLVAASSDPVKFAADAGQVLCGATITQ